MNNVPIIALLTDFGLSDAYVGTMKGVLLSICPAARLIDLSHDIEPQNVRQAAYVLLTAVRYFPANTVFLIVIDPGVGTAREPIAVQANHGTYVAPNNGVLSFALRQAQVKHKVILENPDYRLSRPSMTFHGRDVFSPAAAHLANGVPITALGPALGEWQSLPDPRLEIALPRIGGEVLHIDHFGNIITSIGELNWTGAMALELVAQFGPSRLPLAIPAAQTCDIKVGSQSIRGITPTYGSVPHGTLTALVGSSGQLEIGINQGHAARSLGVSVGDPVTLLLSP
jgi:S-adenosylmethionine hydrolase